MEQVNCKKSICVTEKYWYEDVYELKNHTKEMTSSGYKYTSTKYNVKRIKGKDSGFQRTCVKYCELE